MFHLVLKYMLIVSCCVYISCSQDEDTSTPSGTEVTMDSRSESGKEIDEKMEGGESGNRETGGQENHMNRCENNQECSPLNEEIEAYCEGNVWITSVQGVCDIQEQESACITQTMGEDCAINGLRCKMNEGCVDVECLDAFECPPPPPVAIVDCQDHQVVNVNMTPICTPEGQCGYEESYRAIRDCTVDEQICSNGECITP